MPAARPATAPRAEGPSATRDWARPDERQLAHVRALTDGGENAEAYWAWSGSELILQSRPVGNTCDRIYRLPVDTPGPERLVPVSDGRGATTCSYFLPGDKEVIYASTEGGSPTCPPRPDRSQGYVWALYPDYDIYRAGADGSGAAAAHVHAGLRRRGHRVRQGRLDRLYVRARRRHRPLPHGRRRQERAAPDSRRRLRRRRVLQRRLHAHRLARLASEARARARRLQASARAERGSSQQARALRRQRRRHRRHADHLPGRGLVRPGLGAGRQPHHLRLELPRSPRARIRSVGRRRRGHAARAHHDGARLRRVPAVLARRAPARVLVEPRHGIGSARHQRLRGRLARPAGSAHAGAAGRSRGRRRAVAGRSGARRSRRRHGGPRRGRRVHRGALRRARARARGR